MHVPLCRRPPCYCYQFSKSKVDVKVPRVQSIPLARTDRLILIAPILPYSPRVLVSRFRSHPRLLRNKYGETDPLPSLSNSILIPLQSWKEVLCVARICVQLKYCWSAGVRGSAGHAKSEGRAGEVRVELRLTKENRKRGL